MPFGDGLRGDELRELPRELGADTWPSASPLGHRPRNPDGPRPVHRFGPLDVWREVESSSMCRVSASNDIVK